MYTRKRRKRTFYSSDFKERVLAVYYSTEESVAQIAERFEVNIETLRSWIFRANTERKKSSIFEAVKEYSMKKEKLSPQEFEKRIQELEKELEQERMRSVCLDKMIDIAEQELKVDIRKKSGAKQSKK